MTEQTNNIYTKGDLPTYAQVVNTQQKDDAAPPPYIDKNGSTQQRNARHVQRNNLVDRRNAKANLRVLLKSILILCIFLLLICIGLLLVQKSSARCHCLHTEKSNRNTNAGYYFFERVKYLIPKHGARGFSCPEHKGYSCSSCEPGYTLDQATKECFSTQCLCSNGVAATGLSCPVQDMKKCSFCDKNYYLTSNNTCEPYTCTCGNGTAVDRCPNNGEYCKVCEEGFSLRADGENFMPNLKAMDSHRRRYSSYMPLWGSNYFIKSTSKNYKEILPTHCLKNKICTCDKGQPVTGPDCPEDGMNFCQSCDDRRETVQKDGSCLENVCSCKNGLAPKGKRCEQNGLETCVRCDEGFVRSYRYVKDPRNSYEYKYGTSSESYETFNEVTTCVEEIKENDVNSHQQGQQDYNDGFRDFTPLSWSKNRSGKNAFDEIEKEMDHWMDKYFG